VVCGRVRVRVGVWAAGSGWKTKKVFAQAAGRAGPQQKKDIRTPFQDQLELPGWLRPWARFGVEINNSVSGTRERKELRGAARFPRNARAAEWQPKRQDAPTLISTPHLLESLNPPKASHRILRVEVGGTRLSSKTETLTGALTGAVFPASLHCSPEEHSRAAGFSGELGPTPRFQPGENNNYLRAWESRTAPSLFVLTAG
jgi:hypothetical protein